METSCSWSGIIGDVAGPRHPSLWGPCAARDRDGWGSGAFVAPEDSLFHGEVGFDVLVDGGRVLVAEPGGRGAASGLMRP